MHADPANATLKEMVAQRTKLAMGKNVLVVTGATKAAEEKRRAHLFLMNAIVADRIERVKDLNAAKALLAKGEEGSWDWVYVDDASTGRAEKLFGCGSGGGVGGLGGEIMGGRKRKRGVSEAKNVLSVGATGGVKVVNDEFVVQSLILGALAEDV